MKRLINRFMQDEDGATMVEYALMVVFVAAVCVAIITTLGTQVIGLFQRVQF